MFTFIEHSLPDGTTDNIPVAPRVQQPDEDADFDMNIYEDEIVVCMECGASTHDEILLLCDGEGCGNACHTTCLGALLFVIAHAS